MKNSQKQSCKNCGAVTGINFSVSDEIWSKIIPKRLLTLVVCLSCFDLFAQRKKIDYRKHIQIIYFAGQRASFKFRKVWSARGNS